MVTRWLGVVLTLVFASPTAFAARDVVVILSEASELPLRDGKSFATGVYLNELMIPVMELLKRKHALVFATPAGKGPSFDPASDDAKLFGGDKKLHQKARELLIELRITGPKASLLSFAQLNKKSLNDVVGVFVPGGHAPVVDLAVNAELGKFLRGVHARSIPTALICHGPIAILSALDDPKGYVAALSAGDTQKAQDLAKGWIYAGYKMSIFSTPEEKIAEEKKLKGLMFYYPDDALKFAGGEVSNAASGRSNVVLDRELLTGQNPVSAAEFAKELGKLLGGNIDSSTR